MKDLHGLACRKAVKNAVTSRRHKLLLLGGLLSVAAIAPVTALAAAADNHTLDTVTVQSNGDFKPAPAADKGYVKSITRVASKAPATLRQIPQSVSMITQQTIEDRNYTTLDELAYGTPGVRVLASGRGRSSIYARGFEYSDYNINGLSAPMSSITGTVPNLAAFERVEILRGPSGLFNATSEMGGIINMVLKKPTDSFQGHISGQYGSFNHHNEQLDLSGSMSSHVNGRMVIANDSSDTVMGFDDPDRSQTYYGTTAIEVGDNTELTLAVLRQEREMTPANGVPTDSNNRLIDFDDDAFAGAYWNNFEARSTDVIAELKHGFADGSEARAGVRYSDRHANFNYVFGGSGLDAAGKLSLKGLGGYADQKTWSADASYYHPFLLGSHEASFVIGSDYKHYSTDQLMHRARIPGGKYTIDQVNSLPYMDVTGAPGRTSLTDSTLEDYGVYGKLTYHLLDNLAIIGGARVSGYKIETTNGDRSESSLTTPYAGIVYDLSAHHTIYASYSRVFKPQSEVDANNDILKPREGEQYEVGVKSSYFGARLHTRLSAFSLKDENAAATSPSGTTAALGERRVRGIEAEVSGSVTNNLDVIFGYTYLSTKVDTGTLKQETVFMLMPQNRANLWGLYHFDDGTLNGLKLGAGVSAVGHYQAASPAGEIKAPGYATVNAMIGYQITPKLSTKLNINNLLNKDYYKRVGSPGTFNIQGEPVNVMASVRYDF